MRSRDHDFIELPLPNQLFKDGKVQLCRPEGSFLVNVVEVYNARKFEVSLIPGSQVILLAPAKKEDVFNSNPYVSASQTPT